MWGATCLRSGCVFPWNPGVSWGGCREQSAELSECLSEWEPKSQATTTASCGKLPWGKPVFLTMIPHCHFCAPPAWYTKPPVAWSGAHWGSPLQVQFFVLYQALFESYPCPESSGTEAFWCPEAGSWHMWHSTWDEESKWQLGRREGENLAAGAV